MASETTECLTICFHCLDAVPLFHKASKRIFGGAEVRSRFFALELAKRDGFQVKFMVADDGQPRKQAIDGLTLMVDPMNRSMLERFFDATYNCYRDCCKPRNSFPYFEINIFELRLFWVIPILVFHRLFYSPWKRWVGRSPRALKYYSSQQVDIYCLFGANDASANIVATGNQLNAPKSVLFLLHDDDVAAEPNSNKASPRAYCLRNANLIVAQTNRQAALLRRNFGRCAVVIRNPMDLSGPQTTSRRDVALWIGRSQAIGMNHKRPELLFDLARRCPTVSFLAIINNDNPHRFRELLLERPANVEIVTHVPFTEIDAVFARAKVFVSTSGTEGFPNTFLQAGKHRVPILSLTVDPDGMLTQHNAGLVFSGDLEAMATSLKMLWNDSDRLDEIGQHARRYVETFHDIRHAGDALETALRSLVKQAICDRNEVASIGGIQC
jgi:glycosyltransferase involved in cell wall biosynthesis